MVCSSDLGGFVITANVLGELVTLPLPGRLLGFSLVLFTALVRNNGCGGSNTTGSYCCKKTSCGSFCLS